MDEESILRIAYNTASGVCVTDVSSGFSFVIELVPWESGWLGLFIADIEYTGSWWTLSGRRGWCPGLKWAFQVYYTDVSRRLLVEECV
jgi:hypothetical protein